MLDIKKITRGYQVTLPQNFREKWHLKVGDLVEFIERDGELLLKPLRELSQENAAQRMINFLRVSGKDIHDLSEEEILKKIKSSDETTS